MLRHDDSDVSAVVMLAYAGIQECSAKALDSRVREHDVLLAPDLRNGHLVSVNEIFGLFGNSRNS